MCLFSSHRLMRDLFLSCNGVSQIIELNYLDGIRGHSLKAFETLIISLGEQQKESSAPGTNGMDVEQKELTSSLNAVTTFHNQPALSDSPQSLSKFYASLRDACPKKRRSVNQDVHINTIHLFLCVAFLCVSKEADSDGESTHDSEDTSGYDSTASEPLHRVLPRLPLENLVLPSPKHMHQAADVWSMCRRVYMLSPVVQEQFYRLGGVRVCHRLIFMIIERLFRSPEEEQGKKAGDPDVSENQESVRTSPSEVTVKEVEGHATPPEWSSLKESADHGGNSESQRAPDVSRDRASAAAAAAAPEEAKVPESQASLQSIRLLEALLAICLHSTRASQHKMELELPDQVILLALCPAIVQ